MRLLAILLVVASALAFASAPAAAQVPDPAPVVDEACALLPEDASEKVPLCPQREPDVPVAPANAHEHEAPAPPPANPEDAQQLVDTLAEQAGEIAGRPSEAPDRLGSIVATLVQFLKDFLGIPKAIGDAAMGAWDSASKAVGDAAASAKAAASDAAGKVGAFVASLWNQVPVHPDAPKPDAPTPEGAKREALDLAHGALKSAGVPAPI